MIVKEVSLEIGCEFKFRSKLFILYPFYIPSVLKCDGHIVTEQKALLIEALACQCADLEISKTWQFIAAHSGNTASNNLTIIKIWTRRDNHEQWIEKYLTTVN